jgi:Protein of unknown function (DUF3027)
MTRFLSQARAAAVESHGEHAVGDYIQTLQEAQDQVLAYQFASKVKGYPDWLFNVLLFVDGDSATVSEVLLLPGETSLTAPSWVPWSERLADYKALQAALEADAAAAAVDEDEEDIDEGAEEVIDDQNGEIEESARESNEQPAESALADVPEEVDTKDESDDSGVESKGFFKWKGLGRKKKRK